MFDIADEVLARLRAGTPIAIATVVGVQGSAPRAPGASLAVDANGAVIGSISGGCVEGAASEACSAVLDGGAARIERFGISDDAAMSVGLMCGGVLDVLVRDISTDAASRRALEDAEIGRAASLGTIVAGPAALVGRTIDSSDDAGDAAAMDAEFARAGIGTIGAARLRSVVRGAAASGRTGPVTIECDGAEVVLFVETALPPPRMLVFGATDFAGALAVAATHIGYRVTVCDPREAFATTERFPQAAEVVVGWPDEYLASTTVDARTVVCVLSHDERFDVPLLECALGLPVAFVGAMGSRRTTDRRRAALADRGLAPAVLDRLHAPIGLDIGASSPEETAVSILAEIIASRTGASGAQLTNAVGPIHATDPPAGPLSG
ncbi:XdhC family protein [Planctomonas psychrotolerans]|uniref:XdhC family protein n=1 Tax=Planctomonas psychrotolerans TaxID=2528712 RepID=UPI00123B6EBB|nr:XdhC/CoxI family protein [Planctomonas psychrotolerans]